MERHRTYMLNDRDRRTLAAIQLSADFSLPQVAKLTRQPVHAVRRVVDVLTDRGIIRRLWYINPFARGLNVYSLFFSVAAGRGAVRAKLETYLMSAPEVVFIIALAGRFQYCVTVEVASLGDFVLFMENLANRFGPVFSEKIVSTMISLTDFPLVKDPRIPGTPRFLRIEVTEGARPIDPVDQKILSGLSADASASLTGLARTCGLPSSTVSYRMQQLRKSGVIAGCRYFVDYFQLGYSFACHLVTLEGMTRESYRLLYEYLDNHPSVYFVERCLGAWELSVGTVLREASELTAFVHDLGDRFGSAISKIETLPTCGFLKLNGTPYR